MKIRPGTRHTKPCKQYGLWITKGQYKAFALLWGYAKCLTWRQSIRNAVRTVENGGGTQSST